MKRAVPKDASAPPARAGGLHGAALRIWPQFAGGLHGPGRGNGISVGLMPGLAIQHVGRGRGAGYGAQRSRLLTRKRRVAHLPTTYLQCRAVLLGTTSVNLDHTHLELTASCPVPLPTHRRVPHGFPRRHRRNPGGFRQRRRAGVGPAGPALGRRRAGDHVRSGRHLPARVRAPSDTHLWRRCLLTSPWHQSRLARARACPLSGANTPDFGANDDPCVRRAVEQLVAMQQAAMGQGDFNALQYVVQPQFRQNGMGGQQGGGFDGVRTAQPSQRSDDGGGGCCLRKRVPFPSVLWSAEVVRVLTRVPCCCPQAPAGFTEETAGGGKFGWTGGQHGGPHGGGGRAGHGSGGRGQE